MSDKTQVTSETLDEIAANKRRLAKKFKRQALLMDRVGSPESAAFYRRQARLMRGER